MRLALALLSCAIACGGDAASPPWEARPDTTWVAARFEEYFEELVLEDSATRQRGILEGESGYRFSRKARLQLAYVARRPGTLRVVVESRSGGESARSWSQAITTGSGTMVLGSFARDLYQLHAFVSRNRIAAIPFASE